MIILRTLTSKATLSHKRILVVDTLLRNVQADETTPDEHPCRVPHPRRAFCDRVGILIYQIIKTPNVETLLRNVSARPPTLADVHRRYNRGRTVFQQTSEGSSL
jgi:hypothetical protein